GRCRLRRRLAETRLGGSVTRGWLQTAPRGDLPVEFVRDALLVALALRADELHEGLRDGVLALRLRLGGVGARGLETVDERSDHIDVALVRRHERCAVGTVPTRRIAGGTVLGTTLPDRRPGLRLCTLRGVEDAGVGRRIGVAGRLALGERTTGLAGG